jgi:predicted nucleic acid-binding protein
VIVVSDTSPILNLTTVGHLELLRSLFGEIVVPPWVAAELDRHGITTESNWMRVVAAQDREQLAELRRQLDPGEAEAIIVAVELQASRAARPSNCGGSGVKNTWACWAFYRKQRSAVSFQSAGPYLTA